MTGYVSKKLLGKVRLAEDDDDIQTYKREWVGLTDEEIEIFVTSLWPLAEKQVRDRLRALEAKLKEKNT